MKKIVFIVFVVCLVVGLSCQEKGTEPQPSYPQNYQQNIFWESLSDSPYPISHADAQGTGRCDVVGPTSPNIKWKIEIEYGISCGPVVDSNGNLYFGTDQFNADYFFSYDKNGKLRWKFKTGSGFKNEGGLLIDKEGTLYSGSFDGYLYAIKSDGTLKWKFKSETGKSFRSDKFSIDRLGNIYIVGLDGYLYAINSEGSEMWKIKIDEGGLANTSTTISPDGKTIYATSRGNNLYSISINGDINWVYKTTLITYPSIDNEGNIYFCSFDDTSSYLISLKPAGTERWKYVFAYNYGDITRTSPAIDRWGNIYFAGFETNSWKDLIISVDYYGRFRWSFLLKDVSPLGLKEEINGWLVCDYNGNLYFGSTYGIKYYCLSSNGELLWELPLNGLEVDYSTAFDKEGTLYFGTNKSGGKPLLFAIK